MRVNAKQERPQIRTFEQLLRRYDLEAIAAIKVATENTTIGLNKTNATLEQFVIATMGTLENMQSQIDGNISTWFFHGKPTLESEPAKDWATVEEKDAHLGDLYYDKDTGYGYRFSATDNTYEWIKLTDNDVVEALAIANEAQDTADGKRRVFTDIPSPPYDVGDLWFKEKEIYICNKAKAEGGKYESDDFGIATKYTDDTKAEEVASNLAKNYSTTSEMNSAISKSAEEMLLTMAATYTTKNEFTNELVEVEEKYAEVSAKADSLQTTVSSYTTQINSLGSIVTATESMYTQLSDKFNWVVKSGTSSTNFILTDRMAELTTEIVSLNAKVKVNGDMIVDGSITAKKIDVADLFAQDITASGTINGAKIYGAYGEFTKGFEVNIPYDVTLGESFVMKLEGSEFGIYMDTEDMQGMCGIYLGPMTGIVMKAYQGIDITATRGVYVSGEFTATEVYTSAGVSLNDLNSKLEGDSINLIAYQGEINYFISSCKIQNDICKFSVDFAVPVGTMLISDGRIYVTNFPKPLLSNSSNCLIFECIYRNTASGAIKNGMCKLLYDGSLAIGIQCGEIPFSSSNNTTAYNEIRVNGVYGVA